MELMVVTCIMGALAVMAVPSFRRGIEQARVDQAAANLRTIWAAQRLYRLDAGAYAGSLGLLRDAGLIDASIVGTATPFAYTITAADALGFTATAARAGSGRWSGTLALDASGQITGSIGDGSVALAPARIFTEGES
jgi:type II secretory pathway pseudopilin PulG